MAIIRGTGRADDLRGTAASDTIYGFGGDDEIGAGAGRDRVFGGGGDDVFDDVEVGPDGNDFYDGGAGRDTITFEQGGSSVALVLQDVGNSRAVQGNETDLLRSVENVTGSQGDDVIFGNSSGNVLDGVTGDDRLFGRGGNDQLFGSGDVHLEGGAGNDALFGSGGRLSAFGGLGADTLYAGVELASSAGDFDRSDLGRDTNRDTFVAGLESDVSVLFDFNTERVVNFRAQDRLDIFFETPNGRLQAGDLIDSDGNGVVNDADQDARLVGGNLLLDIDQLFEREANPPVDLGEQHVILEGIARINADQFV